MEWPELEQYENHPPTVLLGITSGMIDENMHQAGSTSAAQRLHQLTSPSASGNQLNVLVLPPSSSDSSGDPSDPTNKEEELRDLLVSWKQEDLFDTLVGKFYFSTHFINYSYRLFVFI